MLYVLSCSCRASSALGVGSRRAETVGPVLEVLFLAVEQKARGLALATRLVQARP